MARVTGEERVRPGSNVAESSVASEASVATAFSARGPCSSDARFYVRHASLLRAMLSCWQVVLMDRLHVTHVKTQS